ncbi:MAG: M48 family metalloprotease [Actinobacteria bacterium]|nr:M48 family metalloprotease [Actinomycetota bacterium]MCL6105526.1 M48 family metalloprotease [Actinomycetota bacterium]
MHKAVKATPKKLKQTSRTTYLWEQGLPRLVKSNKRAALTPAVLLAVVTGCVVGAVLLAIFGNIPIAVLVGFFIALCLAGIIVFYSTPLLFNAVDRALRLEPGSEHEQPGLYNFLNYLCPSLGLPVPTAYIAKTSKMNICAIGRTPATGVLIVTTGLLEQLSMIELEAVLSHELMHIKRNDIFPATVLAFLKTFLHLTMLRVFPSSDREIMVDISAVSLTRYPPALRMALDNLQKGDGHTLLADCPRLYGPMSSLWIIPQLPKEQMVHDLNLRMQVLDEI